MANKKIAMSTVYTIVTLVLYFTNSFNGFLFNELSIGIKCEKLYGFLPFLSYIMTIKFGIEEGLLLGVAIAFLIPLLSLYLMITLLKELKRKNIYLAWGIILVTINAASFLSFIAFIILS